MHFQYDNIRSLGDQVINCNVDGFNLSCSLQLDGVSDPEGGVQVPYARTVFLPLAPIIMGAAGNLSVSRNLGDIGQICLVAGLARSRVIGLGSRLVGLGRSRVIGLGRSGVLGLGRSRVIGLGRSRVVGHCKDDTLECGSLPEWMESTCGQ